MRDFDKTQENGPPSTSPSGCEGLSAQNRNTLFKSLTRIRGAAEVLSDLAGGPRGADILREGGLAFLASIIDEESLNLMMTVQTLHHPPGA